MSQRTDFVNVFHPLIQGESAGLERLPDHGFSSRIYTDFRVNRAYGKDAIYVMNRREDFSRAFGTDVTREEEALVITA